MASINGMKVILSGSMTTLVEVEVERTFYERWIHPLKHGITVPFEPWVKTKKVTKEVPSMNALFTKDSIVMHPEMFEKLKKGLPI